ncbi:hypothetical protein [Salinicola halimionae]|uniref:hypothetical protein n=1 Tax=Salinicola halimionae TaxID=1949081 RepID=UPI000DA15C56|nr:hypothetical protein [Salinicola halimionae]
MIGDPQRLQYLEAMGIAAWTSRYRFVNARPTEQGEWEVAAAPAKPAPGQRLQALLESPSAPVERHQPVVDVPSDPVEASTPPARARALLEGVSSANIAPSVPTSRPVSPSTPAPVDRAEEPVERPALADPLRFTLSLSVIGDRWWLMLPGGRPLSEAGQTLLGQMLKSIGVPANWSALSSLSWPLMSLPASDPSAEAREGIQVFCAGQAQRHGLTIDGAIVVGDDSWAPLLSEAEDNADWACHSLPHPDDLLASADAKRECWTRLQSLAHAWQQGASQQE